eukprot:CAMPEP_0172585950 /NCGR_PEP_ID=MMETSP1068-20121228/5339_1 /TAXON_ID=35684 /ORGANISM="Pseudopedinella elastica, Strain CCMP716" /LENGTH=126 /DNA_ID=CAMNT_0013380589 /DNA_START=137 /DNA_END=514 /DNA_ORIENTATION=+
MGLGLVFVYPREIVDLSGGVLCKLWVAGGVVALELPLPQEETTAFEGSKSRAVRAAIKGGEVGESAVLLVSAATDKRVGLPPLGLGGLAAAQVPLVFLPGCPLLVGPSRDVPSSTATPSTSPSRVP